MLRIRPSPRRQLGTLGYNAHGGFAQQRGLARGERMKTRENASGISGETRRNKWACFAVIIAVGIIFAMNNSKVPPNMLTISDALSCPYTLVGNLMTVTGICGMMLTIPGGFLVKRFGPRRVGLVGIALSCVGATANALTANIYAMLAFRFMEAIGFCLCPVVVMTFISALFPPDKRGLPTGIWSCWITLGTLIMFNASSPLSATFGYRGSFWLAAGLLLLGLILFAAFARMPENDMLETGVAVEGEKHDRTLRPSGAEILKMPAIWLLALTFFGFAFVNQCLVSFYPTYMQLRLGMAPAAANASTSMVALGGILSAVLCGLFLNRLPRRYHSLLLLVLSLLAAACAAALFRYPNANSIGAFAVIAGLVIYTIPPTVYSIAPELASHPSLIPVALAIVTFAQNASGALHSLILSPMISAIRDSGSMDWSAPAITLATIAAMLLVGGVGQYLVIRAGKR